MRTLSEVGKHAMCTYHVRGRNEKIVASAYLTSESVLRRAIVSTYLKVAFNFHDLSLRRLLPLSSMKHLGDRSSGYFTAFPATYNSGMKGCYPHK